MKNKSLPLWLKQRHGRGSEAHQTAKTLRPARTQFFASEVLILSKPGRKRKSEKIELSSILAYQMDALMYFEGATVNGKNPHYRSVHLFPKRKKKRPFETIRGPQTGMLPRLDLPGAQGAFKDSMIHFCNSHYLSQFAAFFIDGRTKRSVAKSCF